jgi:hypothetical protein
MKKTSFHGWKSSANYIFSILPGAIARLELALVGPLLRTKIQIITPSDRLSTVFRSRIVVKCDDLILEGAVFWGGVIRNGSGENGKGKQSNTEESSKETHFSKRV